MHTNRSSAPVKLIDAQSASGGTTITSSPFWVRNYTKYSVQFTFSGSVYGTGSLESSNDGDSREGGNPGLATHWTPITAPNTTVKTVSASIVSGDTSNVGYMCQGDTGFHFLRAKFVCSTDTNNTGSISAILHAKNQ